MQDPHNENLLEVEGLKKYFPIKGGFLRRTVGHVKAVDGVSFDVKPGETLGLVGESGSGKTTTGRAITGLYRPTEGTVLFRHDGSMREIGRLTKAEMKPFSREIQVLFQDPNSSLNPRMRIGDIIAEPLEIHGIGTHQSRRNRVEELLERVGMTANQINGYPHQLSGGQRQRVGVARALSIEPQLIVCDEPVSALDVSVQAQVLNLLKDLQDELGIAYLFIAHDLSVVEYVCDRIMVMYLGKVVESAPTQQIFAMPKHPYTEALLQSIPSRSQRRGKKRFLLEGDIPSPASPPPGCSFHTRCKYAEEICRQEVPPLAAAGSDATHLSACHFKDELDLKGYAPPNAA